MATKGYRELSRQLTAMGAAAGGKALRGAATQAMLPALRAAQRAAPKADPPYQYGDRTVDPYPQRTYKGRLRVPGFASRNVARKSILSRSKSHVTVMLGVKPEAFYVLSFYEFGTSRFPKRPWLEPAFRGSVPAVDARFRTRLKALIDRGARR